MNDKVWKCPICEYEIEKGEPFYYSYGNDRRIEQLSTLPPFDIELICTIKTGDMFALESGLHARFRNKRINGEWFKLDQEDVDWLVKLSTLATGGHEGVDGDP